MDTGLGGGLELAVVEVAVGDGVAMLECLTDSRGLFGALVELVGYRDLIIKTYRNLYIAY
ncbi:MAG TPA: hypothetical protein V6D16_14545 [Candidatus Obscuribacterales bacterium]